MNGLDVWRRVHDLLPGTIAVLLGPVPGISSPGSDPVDGSLNGFRQQGRSLVQRDEVGAVQAAVLVADRARYLDEDGVIDPDVYLPGELTHSLCAPWQYDFRDCGCFYWAASKPDIVTSSDGQFPYLNFQRRDRTSVPPPTDTATVMGRREQELDYAELVSDRNSLPVVVNDREDDSVGVPPPPDVEELTREQVLDELDYLATVEHALCVEYLFAHYSVAAPMQLPADADAATRRVHAAAFEVFSVAVDEMRHLPLGQRGADPAGPPAQRRPGRPNPSAAGPAVRVGTADPRAARLVHRGRAPEPVGRRRHRRDVRAAAHHDRPSPGPVSRAGPAGPPDQGDHQRGRRPLPAARRGQGAADRPRSRAVPAAARPARRPAHRRPARAQHQNYAVLLDALAASLTLGDRAGGALLEQSRRAMFSLHETNHLLAARGVAPPFTLPDEPAGSGSALDRRAAAARQARQVVAERGGAPERELVLRQEAALEELFARMHSAATDPQPGP